MAKGRQLSIRARLTLIFVIAITIILTFTGVALVNLVHRSLLKQATNQIDSVMEQTQQRLATANVSAPRVISLPTVGDVVVQVTNYADTRVLAASSSIQNAPVLARPVTDALVPSGLTFQFIRDAANQATLSELSSGDVSTISTTRGPALVFGFVYGGAIEHSVRVLLVSLLISFPLLLLMSGGLIWLGIGLALAPVESIRRRVDAIAAEDLTERVPVTGGDDEIARMARTVNAMLDRLESASKFQQEFVSNASHELRSPLTTLLATTERATSDPANANWTEVADVIMREGRRLDGIIGDLFWLARHDEDHILSERADVDFDDLLYEEATRVRSMSELVVDTSAVHPTRVVGDPAMLKRMIRNVVDNAMRYAQHELRFAAHFDGDEAVVVVSDDGEGIDVDQSARFFERFTRADSARSRQSGGTGLGLAIVTEIVIRHGGSARFMTVDSGSTIELRVRSDGQRLAT
ncbi:MAG TPA: ATP-binding protein [Acidimicrobiales bacterium]|jgi:signal transduction histidine kinase|nr:ATP-binding protein [Acidimicrobiales bacterium]